MRWLRKKRGQEEVLTLNREHAREAFSTGTPTIGET